MNHSRMRAGRKHIGVALCCVMGCAVAQPKEDAASCIAKAANEFGIPETPIRVILDVEAGTLGKVSRNTNGSYDIGPMQINSLWLKPLREFGISEADVRDNLCINISVGAWILAKQIDRHKDIAKAIAHYHSSTPKHQHRYLGLIRAAAERRLAKNPGGMEMVQQGDSLAASASR